MLRFELECHTVAQLKKMCRDKKLPVSGNKSVLVDRLTGEPERKIAKIQRADPPKASNFVNFIEEMSVISMQRYTLRGEVQDYTKTQLQDHENYSKAYFHETPDDFVETDTSKLRTTIRGFMFANQIALEDDEGVIHYSIQLHHHISPEDQNWAKLYNILIVWNEKTRNVILQVNVEYLEYLIRENPWEISCRRYFTQHCTYSDVRTRIEEALQQLQSPRTVSTVLPEPLPLGLNVNLQKCQLDCVSWMKSVEQSPMEINCSPYVKLSKVLDGASPDILVDPSSSRFIILSNNMPQPRKTMEFEGGANCTIIL